MNDYKLLLSPFQLGHLTLKNRIVSAPTSLAEIGPNHSFSRENIAYYELRAKGGAALVNVGECIAHGATGIDHPSQVVLDTPDALPSMFDLVETIHKYGAHASIEFGHGGKRCNPMFLPGNRLPIGPCDIRDAQGRLQVQGMNQELLEEVKAGYRRSAANCALAGFDMLTIHLGHGWLLGQFLSPLSNHRTDAYGGSRENRCRYPIEILQAVRQAAPKCLIEIRISGSELTADGYDLCEGVELCRLLEPYVDLINVSAGVMEDLYTWIIMHPSMFLDHGCNVYLAEAVKKAVHKPVSCVGALGEPREMERILEEGKADLIALGRALVADPDLPNKLRSGREAEIRRCLRCFSCHGQMLTTRNIRCTVNPVIGRELEHKYALPPRKKHRVLVAGGGPGGMQAAITAAQRGHAVTLFESEDTLGGNLKFAAHESFKQNLYHFVLYQIHMLEKLGVEVRTGCTLTPELLKEQEADTVIVAAGARPVRPEEFGIPGGPYVLATDLFAPETRLGKEIVIVGGGLVGCETAIHLAETGHRVTVLEMADEVAPETTPAHRRAMKVRMGLFPEQAGGDHCVDPAFTPVLATGMRCTEITVAGVKAKDRNGAEHLFPADTVIAALGLRSRTQTVDTLRSVHPNVVPIGDCTKVAQVMQAVRAGHDAAMALD